MSSRKNTRPVSDEGPAFEVITVMSCKLLQNIFGFAAREAKPYLEVSLHVTAAQQSRSNWPLRRNLSSNHTACIIASLMCLLSFSRLLLADSCSAAQAACFAALDLDPVSCSFYYTRCYKKGGPAVSTDCSDPCAPGCPGNICPEALTIPMSQQQIVSDTAPALATSGVLSVLVAKRTDGTLTYTWWNLGEGSRPWSNLDPGVRTDGAPAAALVGKYLFVVIKGTDGALYLNQGNVGGSFVGWRKLGITSSSAASAASSGNTSVVAARNTFDGVSYSWWDLGGAASQWIDIPGNIKINSAPTVLLTGRHVFVVAKALDGMLYLNQGELGGNYSGWQSLNEVSDIPAGGASSENNSLVVSKSPSGAICYNYWPLGGGGKGWTCLPSGPGTDFPPAATLVKDNYVFVAITGPGGHIYLSQGLLGRKFTTWR